MLNPNPGNNIYPNIHVRGSSLRPVLPETQAMKQLSEGADSISAAAFAAAIDRRVSNVHTGPGGRHSNDHIDFRETCIVPTLDELLASDMPFLPLEQKPGEIGFLSSDPDTQLLDRHFRLLCEDLIATVRETHAKENGSMVSFNVKVIGVEMHQFYCKALSDFKCNDAEYESRDPIAGFAHCSTMLSQLTKSSKSAESKKKPTLWHVMSRQL